MEQISEACDNLLTAIRESDAYINYKDVKQRIHEKPEIEREVNEFRKMNYMIQNGKNMDLYEEMDKLEREKARVLENPLVAEYLAAELAFCRVIQQINWKLTEELDFEVGFETQENSEDI